MKFSYSQSGPSRKQAPKSWEVWLADAPFGEGGKIRRCPVAVGKRNPSGFEVFCITPAWESGARGVPVSDHIAAGQDRPCIVRTEPATVQLSAFIHKMGRIPEPDAAKIIAQSKR